MSQIRYRLARVDDLGGLHRTFNAAVQDLDRRNGRPAMERPQEHYDWQRRYILDQDGGGWWLAEDERGEILGWASAILREATWFLSGFWVRPDAQGMAIGSSLLARVLDYGRGQYQTHFVYASDDPRALSLYQRAGMAARFPIWRMGGNPHALGDYRLGDEVRVQPMTGATIGDQWTRSEIDRLDRLVRGATRPSDHNLWLGYLNSGGYSGQLYWRGERLLGYSYLSNWGLLGALVTAEAADFLPLLRHSLAQAAARGFGYVSCDLPSINADAVRLLLDHKWRIGAGHSFFLSSSPLGLMDRYIPSGAALF